ncbi:MAG TPA: hypothetical protein VHI78_10585, partial [Bacteroidales bacterium]|nr:hypothetical protein [Bacteroidales bacterium]
MKISKTVRSIFIHIAGWIFLYLLPPLILQTEVKLPQNFGDFMYWGIIIACFYINYLWLIPKFLSKRKFAIYFLFITMMLVFNYGANEVYARKVYRPESVRRAASLEQRFRDNDQPRRRRPRFRGYNAVLFCFAVMGLGTSIRVTENWYE